MTSLLLQRLLLVFEVVVLLVCCLEGPSSEHRIPDLEGKSLLERSACAGTRGAVTAQHV
jgi:hypothetical protein